MRPGADHEGKTHIPAEQAAPQPDPRIPRAHEHEKRTAGPKAPPRQGPQAPDRQQRVGGFRPDERIRRRAEFQTIFKRGSRIRGRLVTVFLWPNALRRGRLGIAATRKLGGSVQRNRAKRLIREAFRLNKIAEGYDVVVIPNREFLDAGLKVLETDYRNCLERHFRRTR